MLRFRIVECRPAPIKHDQIKAQSLIVKSNFLSPAVSSPPIALSFVLVLYLKLLQFLATLNQIKNKLI